MTKNKLLLTYCVNLMKDFHQNKVNRTHPMVLGSSIGIFLMITFIFIAGFINSHIASPLETPIDDLQYLPRYSIEFFILCFGVLFFNIISFKLSLQGKKYGFIESILHFFSEKKDIHSKLRKSYSWKTYWNSGGDDSIKNKFLDYINELKFNTNDLSNPLAIQFYTNLLQDIDNVYYHDFNNFINHLYNETCEQNTKDFDFDKCAVFVDINISQTEEASTFKTWVFNSFHMFKITSSSMLISISEFAKKLINLIPYFILITLSFSFFNMNYYYGTDNFEIAQLQMILCLELFCVLGVAYSFFSFFFLRKTEDWRDYWNKYGLEFMLLFHQRGSNKIPAYLLPDTEYYNPKDYYKIFDACNNFSIQSLYDDKRNMFFDDAQYYFYIIYNQINRSYDIDNIKKTMPLKSHKPLIFKTFQNF